MPKEGWLKKGMEKASKHYEEYKGLRVIEEPVFYIRPDTLKEIRYLLEDVCKTLCKLDHPCEGCRASKVLEMVEKDLKELNE